MDKTQNADWVDVGSRLEGKRSLVPYSSQSCLPPPDGLDPISLVHVSESVEDHVGIEDVEASKAKDSVLMETKTDTSSDHLFIYAYNYYIHIHSFANRPKA